MDSDSDNFWRESVSKAKDIIEKNNTQQNTESDFNEDAFDEQEEEIIDDDVDTKGPAQNEEVYCICRSSDIDRFMIACDKCGEWFHGDCIGVKKKQAKRIEDWFCSACKKEDPTLQTIYKAKKERIEKTDVDEKVSRKEKDQQKRISRQCGECSACTLKEDCAICDYCKDMRKFGGPGKLRQKCRQRQCHHLSRVGKRLNQQSSVEDGNSRDGLSVIKEEDEEVNETTSEHSKPAMTDHTYSMFTSQTRHFGSEAEKHEPSNKKKVLKVKRANVKKGTAPKSKQEKSNSKASKPKLNGRKRKSGAKKDHHNNDAELASKLQKQEWMNASRTTRSTRKEKEKVATPPKHCLGPGCVNAARTGSKYCSNECGVQLQIRRLQVILPTRNQHCTALFHATKLGEEKIEKCRQIQQACQDTLLELDDEYKALEEILEKSNDLTVLEENQNDEDKDTDLDLTTYCVSCGIPLAPRIAFRHMEKCWAKYECLMSFGAVMKSAGNLFCDTFMVQQQTYCKRLKIMCPEHYKERKIGADEVCGCPLVDQEQKEMDKFCRAARKKCTRHVAWERLRKGEIDLKRVHQWWKLEEAYEQERQLRIEISQRKSILGALFNDTFDHSYKKSVVSPTSKENDIIDVENIDKKGDNGMSENIAEEKDKSVDSVPQSFMSGNDHDYGQVLPTVGFSK